MTQIQDAPFGLVPKRHKSGAPYTGAGVPCYVGSGDGTALFIGDPVVLSGTGNTAEVKGMGMGTFAAGELPSVTKATAGSGNAIFGVVVGVVAETRDSTPYRAASTERILFVEPDPDLIYEVQADEAVAATSIGLNANLVFTNSGSTITGLSGVELDASSAATGATLQC